MTEIQSTIMKHGLISPLKVSLFPSIYEQQQQQQKYYSWWN